MSILEKRHDRTLPYADLHNFGEPAVIEPYDIVNDLDKYLPSGNHIVSGYSAYKMLISSQMEEAQRRAISFKPQVVNADTMTEAQLLGKCQKIARLLFVIVSTGRKNKARRFLMLQNSS